MPRTREDDGAVVALEGRLALRFQRRLAFPIERVWAALVEPKRLADWIGDAEVDRRVDGRWNITAYRDDDSNSTSTILTFRPPILLETGSAEHPDKPSVRWALASTAAGCTLTMHNFFRRGHDHLADVAAHWHLFLDALPGAVEGERAPWDADRRALCQSLEDRYAAKLVVPDPKSGAGGSGAGA